MCIECGEGLDTGPGPAHSGCCGHPDSLVDIEDGTRGQRGWCIGCATVVADFGEGWETE